MHDLVIRIGEILGEHVAPKAPLTIIRATNIDHGIMLGHGLNDLAFLLGSLITPHALGKRQRLDQAIRLITPGRRGLQLPRELLALDFRPC